MPRSLEASRTRSSHPAASRTPPVPMSEMKRQSRRSSHRSRQSWGRLKFAFSMPAPTSNLACYGGFLTGREAARYMAPRGRGTILFTGATASVRGGSGFAAFAAAKFGLRGVAQSMARELAPKNIHVAHLIIDGAIDSEAIHRRLSAATGAMPDLAPDSLIQTSSVAEAYWALHNQSRDGWTHELDLRPYVERW